MKTISSLVNPEIPFDEYYKDLIIGYLKQYGKAWKSEFRQLLIDKLPGSLSDSQKESEIGNLLTSLRKSEVPVFLQL